MRAFKWSVLTIAALGLVALAGAPSPKQPAGNEADQAIKKGLQWLVSVQGADGGWGQDGGETSYVRQGERLESTGNDVANTAVSVLALLHNGHSPDRGTYAASSRRGIEFILKNIEASPEDGLAVTSVTGSQIQRKLGPYIDTFLSSMLLSELDTTLRDAALGKRVRLGVEKCVRKIENNQLKDGSWNISGGWAPILGTSMASRSLDQARQKGVKVDEKVMAKVDQYTGITAGAVSLEASPVPLYSSAQKLEQLSRTAKDREKNEKKINAITGQLRDARFVSGFGSMGGEEFFSYLNISDSLRRTGGPEWNKWNGQIKTQTTRLQNEDGSWAGHHCITGRVAVTSAAILTLAADRAQP